MVSHGWPNPHKLMQQHNSVPIIPPLTLWPGQPSQLLGGGRLTMTLEPSQVHWPIVNFTVLWPIVPVVVFSFIPEAVLIVARCGGRTTAHFPKEWGWG